MREPIWGDDDAHVAEWRLFCGHEAIKHALSQPMPLLALPEETLRTVLCGFINMGQPEPILPTRPGRRGRPPSRTQYDGARDRRLRLFGLLKRKQHQTQTMPKLGKQAGWMADTRFAGIVEAVCTDSSVKAHKRASEISKRFYAATGGTGTQPSRSAIRAAIRGR